MGQCYLDPDFDGVYDRWICIRLDVDSEEECTGDLSWKVEVASSDQAAWARRQLHTCCDLRRTSSSLDKMPLRKIAIWPCTR